MRFFQITALALVLAGSAFAGQPPTSQFPPLVKTIEDRCIAGMDSICWIGDASHGGTGYAHYINPFSWSTTIRYKDTVTYIAYNANTFKHVEENPFRAEKNGYPTFDAADKACRDYKESIKQMYPKKCP